MTKQCNMCRRVLPITSFRKAVGYKDGINTRCIDCRREACRNSHHKHKKDKKRIWPTKPYDIKTKARRKLQAEVKAGRIERKPCFNCGEPNADAHHEDYTKPLEVEWVCRLCHAALHRGDI